MQLLPSVEEIQQLRLNEFLKMKMTLCGLRKEFDERFNNVSSTKPIEIYRQLGVSKSMIIRIYYEPLSFIGLDPKHYVNVFDFDNWNSIYVKPPIKKTFQINKEKHFTDLQSIYYALNKKWFDQKYVKCHSSNPAFDFRVRRVDMLSSNVIKTLTTDPNDIVKYYDDNLDDNILEELSDVDLTLDSHLYEHVKNHMFTNVYIVKNSNMLYSIGVNQKHCAKHSDKINKIKDDQILFVMFKTDDRRVKEYIVEYRINGRMIYMQDKAMKCNKAFPYDFEYEEANIFRRYLSNILLDTTFKH